MAQTIRPYLVTDAVTGAQRLIQAPNPAQARNFVTRSQYRVELVSASDVIKLLSAGVKAEVATDEPVAAAALALPNIPNLGDLLSRDAAAQLIGAQVDGVAQ